MKIVLSRMCVLKVILRNLGLENFRAIGVPFDDVAIKKVADLVVRISFSFGIRYYNII